MPATPHWLQWILALALLAVFASVLLTFFLDLVPFDFQVLKSPYKRTIGWMLLVLVGGAFYGVAREVMAFVWLGLRHLVGLDLEGL